MFSFGEEGGAEKLSVMMVGGNGMINDEIITEFEKGEDIPNINKPFQPSSPFRVNRKIGKSWLKKKYVLYVLLFSLLEKRAFPSLGIL